MLSLQKAVIKMSTDQFEALNNKQNFITLNKHPRINPILSIKQILNRTMSQMHQSGSDNQFQEKKLHYLTILENMLRENTNHSLIKDKVKKQLQKVQGLTYSALVQSEQKYIQKLGLFTENQQLFFFIGELMNGKQQNFLNEYHSGDFSIKSNIKPPPEPEPQPPQEIVKQVQYVLSHVDLPLSLFKRNDNYWSIDNPKTKEAKEYLKKMRQQDQQFKQEMRKKREEIIKEKQQMRSKTIEVIKKQEENQKQEMQQKILKKIEQLKQNDQNRKKAISQSVEFMKEKGVPLFKKIQKDFKQKIQIPSIEQKKRKLTQLRQMMRSVPLQEIQQHRERYQKQKSQHQHLTIVNEPLNISFKSHFYQEIKSMSVSRFNEMQSNLSLYQKRLEYAKLVKENHKPAIDQTKKEEIQSRIKLMNKRRARVKKNKKPTRNSDQEDQEEEVQEPEEQQEEEPEPQENSDDDSDRPRPQKDDQYEPSNKERYKMGLNYLKVARKLGDATKKPTNQQALKPGTTTNRAPTATQNQTISFGNTLDNKEGQQTIQLTSGKKPKFVWVSKYDEEEKKQQRIIYKNYLKQITKGNQSADTVIDTNFIKKEIQKNLGPGTERSRTKSRLEKSRKAPDIQAQIMYHTNLQNKIRNIQQRAKNQEQLLKFKRINKTQKIKKKMAIDDAVVDTIKARLLMMNKTLDV